MSKPFKYILWSIIIIIGIYIFYNISYHIFIIAKYKHSGDWEMHKNYLWIFKESERHKVDTNYFSFSYVKERDVYNNFNLNNSQYKVVVWEFKDLANIELDSIYYKENQVIDNSKIKLGETFHSKSNFQVKVKYDFNLTGSFFINLDNYSNIEKHFSSKNYKGFYGNVKNMSLSKETGEPQIIFNRTEQITPTLLLNYKGNDSFYLIMIYSKKKFDESVLNILNLQ